MAASNVGIANRALQKLGGGYIANFLDNSKEARAVNRAYDFIRQAVLRSHPWNFALRRAALTASAAAPAFGYDLQYQLPTDCLRVLEVQGGEYQPYQVEGRLILTDQAAPLKIRYVADITDPNQFDALFIEAFASRLAVELCEDLTQSNAKRQLAQGEYQAALREARRIDGQENPPDDLPETDWLLSRR